MQMMKSAVASMNSESCDWVVAAVLPSEDLLGLILHCRAISWLRFLTESHCQQYFFILHFLFSSQWPPSPKFSSPVSHCFYLTNCNLPVHQNTEPCNWPLQWIILLTLVCGNIITSLPICCGLIVILTVVQGRIHLTWLQGEIAFTMASCVILLSSCKISDVKCVLCWLVGN